MNLNHARKIQPRAILELPEAFTMRSEHCACRLLLACATYVLTHLLIIGDVITWRFLLLRKTLAVIFALNPQIFLFTFNNGIDCAMQAVHRLYYSLQVMKVQTTLYEGNWFTRLLRCLFRLACVNYCMHRCQELFISATVYVFPLDFHANIH